MDWEPTAHGLSSKLAKVESASLFVAGFVCKARSRLNASSSQNVGCVQAASASTGKSFKSVADYITKHRPLAFTLENLVTLNQVTDLGVSDTDWIIDYFAAHGYSVRAFSIEACEHGSSCRRERNYWVGYRDGLLRDDDPRLNRIQSIVDMCRVEPVFPIEGYLTSMDSHQCQQLTPEEEHAEREYLYKEEHLVFYDRIGVEWPPGPNLFQYLKHLSTRAYEVVVYCNAAFPYQSCGKHGAALPKQFMDANMTLKFLVGDGKGNPWSEQFPTMTGSGIYIMREAIPKPGAEGFCILGERQFDVELRQIDGIEMMQLAGFHLPYMRPPLPSHRTAASMAGNAFSAFAVGVVLLGLFSGLSLKSVEDAECADSDGLSQSGGES